MINIDMEVLANWAERRGLAYTAIRPAQNPAVYQLVHDEIRRTNETLAPSQRAQALRHPAQGSSIPTTRRSREPGSSARGFINERYGPIIAALYDPRGPPPSRSGPP
jgi:long-chain acyl-CoA synthetase